MQHRVFVSSTFKDMQAERDMIQKSLAPSLDNGTDEDWFFTDLRWGINTDGMSEEEADLRIITMCFDKIDSCRPHMVAFLGERYGWIPGIELINNIFYLKEHEKQTEAVSVTELEILYGALDSNEEYYKNAVFCFRKMDMSQMTPQEREIYQNTNAEETGRLTDLKKRILSKAGIPYDKYEAVMSGESGFYGSSYIVLRKSDPMVIVYRAEWDPVEHRIKDLSDLKSCLTGYFTNHFCTKKTPDGLHEGDDSDSAYVAKELSVYFDKSIKKSEREELTKKLSSLIPGKRMAAIQERFAREGKCLSKSVLKAILLKPLIKESGYLDLLVYRLLYIDSFELMKCHGSKDIDSMLIRMIYECPDSINGMKNCLLEVAINQFDSYEVLDCIKLLAVAKEPILPHDMSYMLMNFNRERYFKPIEDSNAMELAVSLLRGTKIKEFYCFAKPLFDIDAKGALKLNFVPENLFSYPEEELLAHQAMGAGYAMFGSDVNKMAQAMWHYSYLCDYPEAIDEFKELLDEYLLSYNDGQIQVIRRMVMEICERDGGRFRQMILG